MTRNMMERAVSSSVGVGIIVFLMALIWRDRPISDPHLATGLRIILSLSAGILAGTVPGFLKVNYNVSGLAIRAAGGFALFLVTFFGSPSVPVLKLGPADIRVSQLPQIDIRSRATPDQPDAERLQSEAVLTIPVSARNVAEPAKTAFLNQSQVMLNFDGDQQEFVWKYFVNMHEEQHGLWLGLVNAAQPQAIPSGQILNKEILHFSRDSINWGNILKKIQNSNSGKIIAILNFDLKKVIVECVFNVKKWGLEIKKFTKRTGKIPGRITMNCEGT